MTDPTPEMVAMARRIAADKLTRREKWLPGVKAGIYEEIVAGKHDGEAVVQIALAAIIETTERAAKLADNTGVAIGYSHHKLRQVIVSRLRSGDHLK